MFSALPYQVGDVARGVGAMAIKGVDKARNAVVATKLQRITTLCFLVVPHGKARELDREHDISGKVMEAGSKAKGLGISCHSWKQRTCVS